MATILTTPDGRTRIFSPTTTLKFAQRLLASSSVLASTLPMGFRLELGLELLLTLYVADGEARHVLLEDLLTMGSSKSVQSRWLEFLRTRDLVEIKNGIVEISFAGSQLITSTLTAIFDAQRALD